MPGTTRYSATFDRTYEEEDRVGQEPPPNARRSRSQSWQAHSGLDRRPYTPLGSHPPTQRSSSTDNGTTKGPEHIPTRTVVKTSVKAHNNPFQFVKVGTCPLYKKAEEQLKKAKEVKKPDVLKEEEEEWQSNLDSWKSRRRKMSEDVFKRQEEIKQLELEEQITQLSQKKTKTFSEMVESRAHRGRSLSLCLISSPMELQNWEMEDSNHKNGSNSTFSGESEENSTVNSEDEGVNFKSMLMKSSQNGTNSNHRTNGDNHSEKHCSKLETHNGDYDKLSDLTNNIKSKEAVYIDSGLESISSSHRAGDTPDSGSDFSQDSGSSIDCESPRIGVNILEDFSTKPLQMSLGHEVTVKLCLNERGQDFGFTFHLRRNEDQVIISSILEDSKAESSGICLGDQIISIDGKDLSSLKQRDIASLIQKGREKGEIKLLLWRRMKSRENGARNGFNMDDEPAKVTSKSSQSENSCVSKSQKQEKSVESENEMYVDDFEELKRQSEPTSSNKKLPSSLPLPIQANGISVPSSPVKDITLNKTSLLENKTSKAERKVPNGLPKKLLSNELVNSEVNTENEKTLEKAKTRVRRKGVYALNMPSAPNQTSKRETSVNSLFPLSPVAELPSPVDNKTIASALSDSLPSPNTQKTNLYMKEVNKSECKSPSNKDSNTPTQAISSENNVTPSIFVDVQKTESVSSSSVTKNEDNKASIEIPQDEKPKPNVIHRKIKVKVKKANTSEELTSVSSKPTKETSSNSADSTALPSDLDTKQLFKDKVVNDSKTVQEKEKLADKTEKAECSKKREANLSSEVASAAKVVSSNGASITTTCNEVENKTVKCNSKIKTLTTNTKAEEISQDERPKTVIVRKIKPKKEDNLSSETASTAKVVSSNEASVTTTCNEVENKTVKCNPKIKTLTTNTKAEETSQDERPKTVIVKKIKPKKENDNVTLSTATVCENTEISKPQNVPSNTTPESNVVNTTSKTTDENAETVKIAKTVTSNTETVKASVDFQDEKRNPSVAKKTKIKIKKNANSQKANVPAKQSEDFTNTNESLNIIFHSEPITTNSESDYTLKNSENTSNTKTQPIDLAPDILPVEKVAEEMEKLILEQLEEEERAKELAAEKTTMGSQDHLLIAPPKCAEPPKEKPPPPPEAGDGSQRDSSLKRVNSTKRIKKEIHKRRSNFLGIDSAEESIVCNEHSIPPPPALEEILKAEMELDRQSRLKIESAASERLILEENEIMKKEREIIETLESEERQRQLINGTEDFTLSNNADVIVEDRIQTLKNERKKLETEQLKNEEQPFLHSEEKQLREREEFIRQQEGNKMGVPLSESSLSIAENKSNSSEPSLPSLSTDTQSSVSPSGTSGDGKSITSNSASELSEINPADNGDKKMPEKPALPPKPLKKKEAIRRERERLRQEQEELQREREEHRRKLLLEQEELMKHQKSHAPDVPVSRLGPLPPLVQPNFPSQLTSTINAYPNGRESASYPSRSHHGVSNVAAGNINTVELIGPPTARQNRIPASRGKAVQSETWGQQKIPSVRKQNQDSLTENRYNQNHWLIQEAEMRRISELKERQRTPQLHSSQTHLAEDDVCSNTPRVPVIPPTQNQHLNYAVQDKMWSYGQSNMPVKKYPPVIKDQLHTIYPREPVSQQPPTKPSRVVPMERQEQMLSVSGRKRCSHCNEELGRGAAMIIESLQLYYHIHCFQCCVCQAQLGNGSCGTDVRVRNNKLHCHNCYSNDEECDKEKNCLLDYIIKSIT